MTTKGPSIGRLEVFTMGFKIIGSDDFIEDYCYRDSRSNIEDSDLAYLKKQARIFFVADGQLIELYSSKTADSLYSDVPPIQQQLKISDSFQKRITGDSFSRRTDVSEASRKRAKMMVLNSLSDDDDEMLPPRFLDGLQKSPVDSTIRGTDLMLTGPNEEEEIPNKFKYTLDLPLTGPNDDMLVDDSFHILIHKDTGIPSEDDGYEKLAPPFIPRGRAWPGGTFFSVGEQ